MHTHNLKLPISDVQIEWLGFVHHYIIQHSSEHLLTNDISIASNGVIDKRELGQLFSYVSGRKLKSKQKNKSKNSKQYRYWETKELLKLLQDHEVKPVEVLGKKSNISVSKTSNSDKLTIPYRDNYLSFLLPSFHGSEIEHIGDKWSSNWGYEYRFSYSLMREVLSLAIPTPTPKRLWLDEEHNGKCLELHHNPDDNFYPMLNESLIRKIFPNTPSEYLNVSHFPATSITRLMGMVCNPYLNWGIVKRGEKRVWASHHTCFNPRCINPNHLKPMTEEDHNDLHKRIGDNHPTNNNNLDFQLVNKHEELVVH